MPVHTAIARNFAEASENKIHSDEIAKRFGFTGALVPGVTVFGHLAWPLTQRLGESWLRSSWVTTRFIKPAYHGETITLLDRESGGDSVAVDCTNDADVLLATLKCTLEEPQPAVDPHAYMSDARGTDERVEITWDAVQVEQPFATFLWQPDEAHNREYAARVDDDTQLFRKGVLHPHAILSQANQVLVRRFVMPAWIHTGSEIRFRRLLRAGDAIEVRAVPLEKWERNGHQFIKLYVAYVVSGEIATEIWHTAIFRVRG
jgi:acyl dehydratase